MQLFSELKTAPGDRENEKQQQQELLQIKPVCEVVKLSKEHSYITETYM